MGLLDFKFDGTPNKEHEAYAVSTFIIKQCSATFEKGHTMIFPSLSLVSHLKQSSLDSLPTGDVVWPR
jgi:hypothetical protein